MTVALLQQALEALELCNAEQFPEGIEAMDALQAAIVQPVETRDHRGEIVDVLCDAVYGSAIAQPEQPSSEHLFEFWWAEHMPKAKQDKAWAAWLDAPGSKNAGVVESKWPPAGFQCEPQPAVTEDGFSEWVTPKPVDYLMQCCDCNLIHEVQCRVAKYKSRPSEQFEVVQDVDMQVQWRMKRRDDLSAIPAALQPLTDEQINAALDAIDPHYWDVPMGATERFARAIEAAHNIKAEKG